MDIKELDRQAKGNNPMPHCLKGYEQSYYLSARNLYRQYDNKQITLEQARREKEFIIEQYKEGEGQWQLFNALIEIEEKLKQLQSEGFNTVIEQEILEITRRILK